MTLSISRSAVITSYATLLTLCCTVTFACYFGSYMRMPVVPLYATSLGATPFHVGMINSSFLLMAGLLSLPLGILSDRIGRKLLILLGLFILSCASLLLYYARTPLQMVWLHLFLGIGLAAFAPTMMSFVADFSPLTHLGRSYGWYTTALYGGMSLGPAMGGFIAQRLGFNQVFIISGIFILTMVGVVYFFLPRARHVLVNKPKRQNTKAAAKALFKNRPLIACWLVTLGGCFGLGMFITFVPLHAHNQGLKIGQIGVVFGAQALLNALSRIPFGHLSDRVARRSNLVVYGLLGFSLSMAGFGVAHNVLLFLVCAAGLGISMGLGFTAIGALIAEVVPAEARGLAMGGYNTCIYLGMMLSSATMGAAIRGIGFSKGFFLTALINLLAIALFFLLMRSSTPANPKAAS